MSSKGKGLSMNRLPISIYKLVKCNKNVLNKDFYILY